MYGQGGPKLQKTRSSLTNIGAGFAIISGNMFDGCADEMYCLGGVGYQLGVTLCHFGTPQKDRLSPRRGVRGSRATGPFHVGIRCVLGNPTHLPWLPFGGAPAMRWGGDCSSRQRYVWDPTGPTDQIG